MRSRLSIVCLGLALLLWATGAAAQQLTPPPPAFDMTGFIQTATLDTAGAICTASDPLLRGGTMTINGIRLIIPCNTILQMPATSLTWAQLFDPAISTPVGTVLGTVPALGPDQTRLALSDAPAPFPSFEVRAQGNVLVDPATGNSRYVVGLIVPITQQGLNIGSGFITYIDYATGSFRVAGTPNDPGCVVGQPGGGPSCSGALVQFNDPVGRYGLVHSPDPRFTVDTGNPTIVAASGFPICIPRVAPPANDALCPRFGGSPNTGNRPLNGDPRFPVDLFRALGTPLKIFDMPAPGGGVFPDARQQVPLVVGDWVDYSGTLFKIDPNGSSIPSNTYISAHTVTANLGIFTQPGILPNYVYVESILIGTGGTAPAPLTFEATTRLTVVGFTTDPTRFIDINAIDVNPCTGEETTRLLATVDPSTQAVRGRFVYRVLGGFFEPATREYVMVNEAGTMPNVANGLTAGQFRLPNFDFIGPEFPRLGDPVLSMNFEDMPFLAQGSGPLFGTGPLVGQLDPWPGTPAPAKAVCAANGGTAPIVSAGANFTARGLTVVTLTGTRTLDPNSIGATNLWTQTGGPTVTLVNPTTLTPTFTAPNVNTPTPLTFALTVTDQFGSTSSSVIVTLIKAADTVTWGASTWRPGTTNVQKNGNPPKNRNAGKLSLAATSTDPSAILTVDEVAINGTVLPVGTMGPTVPPVAGSFALNADGFPQPARLILRSSSGGTATAICGAPDAKGIVTCQ
jgi:K319-like protein